MSTRNSLCEMGESSLILSTACKNQDEIRDEDKKKEVLVTIIPKVVFTTTEALLNQGTEISSKEDSKTKPISPLKT